MGRLSTHYPHWRIKLGGYFACVSVAGQTLANPITSPFHGCTFYKARLAPQSYGGGLPRLGCANFSAVNGRNGCSKTKGVCPFCVVYSGDDVQMWVPNYFIEVTKHVGRSVFADSVDTLSLQGHLKLAAKWWESSTLAPLRGKVANKLCMGSLGNLLPRTGCVLNEDSQLSAMIAAYKFMSAAGYFHLSPDLKLQPDDKWQIVYHPQWGCGWDANFKVNFLKKPRHLPSGSCTLL